MSGLIARLIEAGTPAALVEEVALELMRARVAMETLEARRAKDRERKRSSEFHGNPRSSTEGAEIQGDVSLDKSPPDPKKLIPSLCVDNSSPRARGFHRLPEGWRPTKPLPPPLQAKVDQWPPGAFDDEVAALKRWAANAEDKNGKGRKLDWDKALWNWLGRRHDERYRRTNGLGGHQSSSSDGLSSTARAAIAVFGLPAASH